MRAKHQSRILQSRTIEPQKQQGTRAVPMLDNRDTAQMRVINMIQQKPNNTGLPDNLKSGVENLSGFSLDDIRVHYNSDKPAQLQALAYTQGSDIHVAPGQEKHLPHETWHAVQQMQGRVQPTMQLQGVNVNDNTSLEKEADVMGWQAISGSNDYMHSRLVQTRIGNNNATSQLLSDVKLTGQKYHYWNYFTWKAENVTVGKKMEAWLDHQMMPYGELSTVNTDQSNLMTSLSKSGFNNMIRGHLLNDNLGGLAVNSNLYPITSSANNYHCGHVENHIKTEVENNNDVYYEVNVNPLALMPVDPPFILNFPVANPTPIGHIFIAPGKCIQPYIPNVTFNCTAHKVTNLPLKAKVAAPFLDTIINSTINDFPLPIAFGATKGFAFAPALVNMHLPANGETLAAIHRVPFDLGIPTSYQ